MNFALYQSQFQRLSEENAAWQLLQARRAPTILAFLASIFAEQNEIAYGQARLLLDGEIARNRESGFWEEGETPASTYLNEWIKQGWLRELDDQLMPTDAAQIALCFVRRLDERVATTTASRLRLVQDAVRDFVARFGGNPMARLAVLQQKRAEIEQEIAQLETGFTPQYSVQQEREMLRQIHDLAAGLTHDFRYIEDQIRQLDKKTREIMIKSDLSRGQLLQQVFEKEKFLERTEAGSAFNGFYELLSDPNRQEEFRTQLLAILQSESAQHLSPPQQRFLARLLTELTRESNRVFTVRRRTEQELRAYVESGVASENQVIVNKIRELERLAILLRENHVNVDTTLNVQLNVGKIQISSPQSMKLHPADGGFQAAYISEHVNRHEASEQILQRLNAVQIRPIAVALQSIICQSDEAHTLASLVMARPIERGMEELVAYYRVLRAVLNRLPENNQDNDLKEEFEELMIQDENAQKLLVRVPLLRVSATQFPEYLDDLAI
ncbi:MAG: DUF3375 domain-containing protein [Alysiella sp.]|uniref:DUF3375 domain-containing protein n=1 Tax=Alysiella sp. TaxID=1872483 RepID=UPI0026DBAF3F|nr:DUF3375 domain-containing protein [Alysiella sp.]MDO4433211.1 DUF3375 domain-containing protein [Alysiella sp.]